MITNRMLPYSNGSLTNHKQSTVTAAFISKCSCSGLFGPYLSLFVVCRLGVHSQPAHNTATNTEWQLPEVALTQFVSPDDEHNVLETCRELKNKNKYIQRNLCVTLVIYQESWHFWFKNTARFQWYTSWRSTKTPPQHCLLSLSHICMVHTQM